MKRKLLTGVCVLLFGVSGRAYPDDAAVTLDGDASGREGINEKKMLNRFICAMFLGIIAAISPLYASPLVETKETFSTTWSSAVVEGKVTSDLFPVTSWIEYGTESGKYSDTSLSYQMNNESDTGVRICINKLSSDKTYYYRLAAQNRDGIAYGEEKFFATSFDGDLGQVTRSVTGTATAVGSDSAVLNGTVSLDSVIGTGWADLTTYFFAYGTVSGKHTHTTYVGSESKPSNAPVSALLEGLLSSTVYYYQLAAQSDAGEGYGEEESFTTLVAETEQLEADFSAGVTEFSICTYETVQFTDTSTGNHQTWLWDFGNGTTSNEQNPVATYLYSDVAGSGSKCFTVSLTVSNEAGSDTETKECYITLSEIVGDVFDHPQVTTGSATNITADSATLNGTVSSAGADTKTWFEYYSEGTEAATAEAEETGNSVMSAQITKLSPDTTYFYRILSQNIDDPDDCIYVWDTTTVEGDEVSFTTKSNSAATGKIYGTVIDADGSPIETAKVICKGKKAKEKFTTDAEGYFEFDELGKGMYKITVSKKEYKNSAQMVKLGKGAKRQLNIILKKK